MQQLQNVLDFVAAHLALLESVARGDRPVGDALRWPAPRETMGFEVTAHARVGRALHAGGTERYAQVVVVKLGGPAGVGVVLLGQRFDRLGREAWEPTDVSAHLVTQCLHRIGGLFGGIQPAFDGRDGEALLKAGERMPPDLGGECAQ
jgi:hypothetical protein